MWIVERQKSCRPPIIRSSLLIFFGMVFLCLLDGQNFTHAIVFMFCVAVSGVLWLRYGMKSGLLYQRGVIPLLLSFHIGLLMFFSIGLPTKYRWQQDFNIHVSSQRDHALK
jgi:hypothetical protein